VNLVSGLLRKDRHQRLGSQGGSEEIIAHPFFKSIDVDKLLKKEIEAPFIPEKSKDAANAKYFNVKSGEELAETIIPVANLKAIRQHQNEFAGFQ